MSALRRLFHHHRPGPAYLARFYVPYGPDDHKFVQDCTTRGCGATRVNPSGKWGRR